MEALEILNRIKRGEDSRTQFKQTINNAAQAAEEFVAFSNTEGGLLFVGVKKNGEILGLSHQEIEKINQHISNAASQNMKAPISPFTENVPIEDKTIIVIHIPKGTNKPYYTNEGISYIKVGSDKRIAPPEEILRMFQASGRIYADEMIINHTSVNDIDEQVFKEFIYNKFYKRNPGDITRVEDFKKSGIDEALEVIGTHVPFATALKNMAFSDGNSLTLAGLLLFGKSPQRHRPAFTLHCISYAGNDISGTCFRDSPPPFDGDLKVMFEKAMTFLKRNLRLVQVETSFNSLGELEIPQITLEEILVNALVHRDYFINASVKVIMFDNRIEIISPGRIPNSLTIENIINGQSISRNPILHQNAQFLLPYKGMGSGIPRAIANYKHIEFPKANETQEQFKVIIHRQRL